MITKDTMTNGLLNYIDAEVMPNLSTTGKIISGTMVFLARPRISSMIDDLARNKMVTAIGVVDEDGNIDADALISALKQNMARYGKLEFDIPLVGNLKFCADDAERLGAYLS